MRIRTGLFVSLLVTVMVTFTGCAQILGLIIPKKDVIQNGLIARVAEAEGKIDQLDKTNARALFNILRDGIGKVDYRESKNGKKTKGARWLAAEKKLFAMTWRYLDWTIAQETKLAQKATDTIDRYYCIAPPERKKVSSAYKGCLFNSTSLCSELSGWNFKSFHRTLGQKLKEQAKAFNVADHSRRDKCFMAVAKKQSMPKRYYRGSDRNKLKKMLLRTWKAKYPKDKILKVVFQHGAWKRQRYIKKDAWGRYVKHDKGFLQVYVFVPHGKGIARGYVAVLQRNYLEKTMWVGQTKNSVYPSMDVVRTKI
jgi:hypothetical protein